MTSAAVLSADTQATLLLSASLGKRSKDGPSPLTPTEYAELVAALHAEGLRPNDLLRAGGASTIPVLVARFSPKMRERVTRERVVRLLERGGQLALALARWDGAGIWVASRADAIYPARYKRKLGRSAPSIVYGVGPAHLLEGGGLAVVGSRKPDESSTIYTEAVGKWAARANVQIVSGAARGVDEGSMLACTDAGGVALGVVAESLLKLSTRRDFREAILAGRMLLVSSFDPDAGFTVPNAMGRNRWIYALADRALVVACSEGRGGTWAGAIEAMRHSAIVFARTGNPQRPGNEALIARGALPAPTDFSELWRAEPAAERPAPPALSALPQTEDVYALVAPVLLRLLRQATNAKQLAVITGLTKAQVDAWLARLVAEGRVEKHKAQFRAVGPAGGQPTLFQPEPGAL